MDIPKTRVEAKPSLVVNLSNSLSRVLALLPFAIITVIVVGPLIWVVLMSFRLTNEIFTNPYALPIPFHVYNYLHAFVPPKEELDSLAPTLGTTPQGIDQWLQQTNLPDGGFGFFHYIVNSVIVTTASLLIVTTITTMAAYVFARQRYAFPGRGPLFIFIFLSMFFPPQITQLSLFQLAVSYKVFNTLWSLILVYPAMAIALDLYLLRAFLAQIPTEIEDASRIDGCNDWQTFWKVMLPIAKPAISTVIIINLLDFWNEFLYALTLVTKPELATIPLATYHWVGEVELDVGGLAAALVISMLPIVILYLMLSEQFMQSMVGGALKG